MKFILLKLLWAGRKIAQIGQTEPVGVTRRRTLVRREVKFVRNTRHYNKRNSSFDEFLHYVLCYFDFAVLIKMV